MKRNKKLNFKIMKQFSSRVLGIGYQGMVPFGLEILEKNWLNGQLINSKQLRLCLMLIDLKILKFYGIYFFILFQIPAIIVFMFFYHKSMSGKIEASTQVSIVEEEVKKNTFR
eukprot:TRINITY_DN2755_c0_g1_i5.p3 TRINITY_DN2755_c0_g1~~TRINITY_DN2755_c0_g1_i5.p3  ORF type:complete len:113 (+),score=8.22 TRINITY_DN2755_c0_g1_i5:738-1076(+)